MKIAKKKTKASLIAMILTLTLVVTFAAELPNTSAVSYYHSYVYVAVTPNIIGVGQQVLVQYFTADLPPDVGEETSGQGTRAGWDNVWITIKDPAGATEKISIQRTDSVGAIGAD